MNRAGRLCVAVALVATAACSTYTTFTGRERDSIDAHLADQPRRLRMSMWYGRLYNDDGRVLLSPYDFRSLGLLQDAKGRTIDPPPPEGVIPAGTVVVVKQVEFPTAWNVFFRNWLSPRYNPWVELYIPRRDDDRPHVLVLGRTHAKPADLYAELDRYLTSDDVTGWLDLRTPAVRQAILKKEVVAGMSSEELVASLGYPTKVERRIDGAETRELWNYHERVVRVLDGHALGDPPGEEGASAAADTTGYVPAPPPAPAPPREAPPVPPDLEE